MTIRGTETDWAKSPCVKLELIQGRPSVCSFPCRSSKLLSNQPPPTSCRSRLKSVTVSSVKSGWACSGCLRSALVSQLRPCSLVL